MLLTNLYYIFGAVVMLSLIAFVFIEVLFRFWDHRR
jgi:hypothetical protein